MKQFARHFLLALQFFTRIPVNGQLAKWVGYSSSMLRASAAHFPGVGWVVGGTTAAVLMGALMVLPALPASAWVAVVLSTAVGVLLTGAFHEDGLADTADGLGGGLTQERILEIMKDSRIGSYGAIALVLALLGKVCLLTLLVQMRGDWAVAGLFAGHVTSRLLPLFVIRKMVHVGDTQQSKSKPLAEHIDHRAVWVGLLWWGGAMGLAMFGLPVVGLVAGSVGAICGAGWIAWRLHCRLQGFTGDGLGATQQLAELGFYLGLILALAHGVA